MRRLLSLSINVRANAFGGRKGVGGNRQGSSPALIQKQVCTGRSLLRKLFLPCKLVQLGEMLFFDKLKAGLNHSARPLAGIWKEELLNQAERLFFIALPDKAGHPR